jgi:2,3-bisphosphoglycerate-independent phosphoglycerate mutase
VFLDGRDTPPKSAEIYLRRLNEKIEQTGVGHIASMIGRYYAMDRDRRWQRVKSAYDLLDPGARRIHGGECTQAGLEAAYARGETDEFVKATAILPPDSKPVKMEDGDTVIFLNFRSDRARQLSRPFIEPDFSEFEREVTPRLATYCTLTGYSDDFAVSVAFPPERIKNGLGRIRRQARPAPAAHRRD